MSEAPLSRFSIVLVLVTFFTVSAHAEPPQTGQFQLSFRERSPHSSASAQNRRHHIRIDDAQRYDLEDETFEIVVPESYDGERPFGVFVWISPTRSGRIPALWHALLEKHHLLGIGANNSGNERGVGVRFGLALDAVHNLTREYNIDTSRIYAAGFSGGGKVAGMLGVIYPDVFQGAVSMGGVGFYRRIPVPDRKNAFYPPTFDRPPSKMFELARDQRRFVLIVGEEDFAFVPVSTIYELGFREDGFKCASLLVIDGLGHEPPDESWLEQAIVLLDSPLADQARRDFAEAVELEKQHRYGEAYAMYLRVSMHAGESLGVKADDRIAEIFERARLELVKARRAAEAENFTEAAAVLLTLQEQYGDALPPEAQRLLDQLRANPQSAAQIKAIEDRAAAQQREANASAALETARLLLERDTRRAYDALRQVAAEYAGTGAANAAAADAERLLADPVTRAQIQIDPHETEARRLLNLAENYYRNRLYAQARLRLEEILRTYPDTPSAAEAQRLLERIDRSDKSAR